MMAETLTARDKHLPFWPFRCIGFIWVIWRWERGARSGSGPFCCEIGVQQSFIDGRAVNTI